MTYSLNVRKSIAKSITKSITLMTCVLLTGSCSKVAFESKSGGGGAGPTPTVTPLGDVVVCDVKVNGQDAAVTIAPTGTNPTVTANCNPTDVTYNWTVLSNNNIVTVSGLTGATSTPDFRSLPPGIYDIVLNASKTGFTSYTSGSPRRVIITAPNTIACDVKVNGQDAPVTISPTGTNPTVAANCSPTDVNYAWTVQSNGSNVTVSGLTGASSTPNFRTLPAGTYDISLVATKAGFTGYTSTSPRRVIVSPPVVPPSIACNVYFNQQVNAVTVVSAITNPDLYADCHPTNVNLNWTVKNAANATVPVNNLHGSSSHPDFFSLGTGVYKVTLNATASGYSEFNSNAITATVNAPTPPLPSIACDVRVNNQTAAVTINSTSSNPTVDGNCSPSDVSYVWTVQSNSTNVVVTGLSSSSSTPDFRSLPPGSYDITLYATKTGYQAYSSSTARRVNVVPRPLIAKTFNAQVNAQNNMLDILLIVDDSNSMLANNQRLASRLQGFVNDLSTSGFDWQMCVTVTRAQKVSTTSSTLYWGASVFWEGNPNTTKYILKSGTAGISGIFTNTISRIGAGVAGSEDERPLKAAYHHIYYGNPSVSGNSGCYRQNAGLAVVAIANEDERSIGGDITQRYYSNEYYPLEYEDYPASVKNQVRDVFGANKRFVFNSIIVRPGDNACMAAQDSIGTKSHFGAVIAQMSQITNGYVGSICDSDYSQSLNYFKDQIIDSMSSITLECNPVGTPVVSITPSFTHTFRVDGNSVIFDPAVPAGRTINVQYNCAQ